MASKTVEFKGMVEKAYNPSRKTGGKEFFFSVRDGEGTEWIGMSSVAFLKQIRNGAHVRIIGTQSKSGWVRPEIVEVMAEARVEFKTGDFAIEHVGNAKPTHYGVARFSKVADGWIVIPTIVIEEYFGSLEVPGNGQLTITAEYKQNGDTVITKILSHKRRAMNFSISAPFSKIYRTLTGYQIKTEHGILTFADLGLELTPEVFNLLQKKGVSVNITGQVVAESMGFGRVNWQTESYKVEISEGFKQEVQELVWNDKVQQATMAVREELKKLLEAGVIVDVDQVSEMFLKQGVQVDRRTAETVFAQDYDRRYLQSLQEISNGGNVWVCEDGFIFEIGQWLVWERCRAGAATYILPAEPNTKVTGRDLTVAEWAAVLGRILPETNKMQLRYGEVGQVLSGRSDGVQFAYHTEDENGNFDNWLNSVKEAVAGEPGEMVNGLPTLEDLGLLLAA